MCCKYFLLFTISLYSQSPFIETQFGFFPKQFTVGFSLRKLAGRVMLWPRPWSLSAMRPPCIPLASPFCPLWPRLQTLSAVCPPCVSPSVCHVPAFCLPCVPLVSALSPLGRASKPRPPCVRLVSVLLCLKSLSAMCPPCVCLAFCPPCVLHVPAKKRSLRSQSSSAMCLP